MKSFAFALALLATPVAAHDYTLGALTIDHPMAFETPPTARSAGGYLTISNDGATPDALIGARSPLPRTEIHRSFEQGGVMKMEHVERLEIPAGETVELAPGGHHVMFMGLTEPFRLGEEIPVTLVFETAGEVEVMMQVESRKAQDGQGMGHGH